MTFSDMEAFEHIVAEVAADESITVFVLASGVPDYFIAHGDLEGLIQVGRGEPVEGDGGSWPRVIALFEQMPQVVVAAVDGATGGGGLELILGATMRVASPRASFSLPEVAFGMMPGGGGTQRLPRLIGLGRAADLILTGRRMHADEALAVGLVQRIFDEDDFLAAVLAWATAMADRPATSLAAAKRSLFASRALPLDEGLAFEAGQVGPLLMRPDTIAIEEEVLRRYAATPPSEIIDF